MNRWISVMVGAALALPLLLLAETVAADRLPLQRATLAVTGMT